MIYNMTETNSSQIWISPPHMSGNEMKYIQEAFYSNWISPFGTNIENFEKDLQTFLGSGVYVSLVSSGTAALHLALRMFGVSPGDYVICQSFSFIASASPIIYQGGVPVFVDSEPDTYALCPQALEDAIHYCLKKRKKPKAIIAASVYGMPFKVKEIKALSERYEIPLLEDSAEALGSSYQEKKCGTFGDLSVLSFNGNKIITTSGGGALISKSEKEKEKIDFWANQAKDKRSPHQNSDIGYNYRMSNISAGIGRGQMEVLKDRISQKRENHAFYQRIFSNFEEVKLFSEPHGIYQSNHWLNAISIKDNAAGFNVENIRSVLTQENIESRPFWSPLHLHPVFAKAPFLGSHVAEHLSLNGLCLPSGSNLTPKEKNKIEETLFRAFRGNNNSFNLT